MGKPPFSYIRNTSVGAAKVVAACCFSSSVVFRGSLQPVASWLCQDTDWFRKQFRLKVLFIGAFQEGFAKFHSVLQEKDVYIKVLKKKKKASKCVNGWI